MFLLTPDNAYQLYFIKLLTGLMVILVSLTPHSSSISFHNSLGHTALDHSGIAILLLCSIDCDAALANLPVVVGVSTIYWA